MFPKHSKNSRIKKKILKGRGLRPYKEIGSFGVDLTVGGLQKILEGKLVQNPVASRLHTSLD